MKKLLLFLLYLPLYADITIPTATEQLLVVSSVDFNTTQATLQAYKRDHSSWRKVFKEIPVNLGRAGLAWGKGLQPITFEREEPLKKEGDGKSPAGLFVLEVFFGYEKRDFNFPYIQADASTLCIDDSDSSQYNQIVQTEDSSAYKSFEYMKRKDDLYKLGIIVGHNKERVKERGSCIFIHIQREEASSTSGCTSMQEEKLLQLMQWLDKSKHPLLLQLPQNYLARGFH